MGALFGLLTSLSIGFADLFGRRLSNARGVLVAGVFIQFVALVISVGALLAVDSAFAWGDLSIGLASGVGLAVGLAGYLAGVAVASSAIVSPIVATMSAVIPYVYALARGSEPSVVGGIGAAVAVAGLVLITVGGDTSGGDEASAGADSPTGAAAAAEAVGVRIDDVTAGVRWAVVAGLGFGFGLSITIDATGESGVWPAVGQRASAFVVLAVAAVVARTTLRVSSSEAGSGVGSGIFAGLSTVFFLLGLDADATTAVITASVFPAITVVVGRVVFGDSVRPRQVMGLAVVVVGITLVALA